MKYQHIKILVTWHISTLFWVMEGKVEHLFNITNEELHKILQSRSEDSFSYVEVYKSHMCIT